MSTPETQRIKTKSFQKYIEDLLNKYNLLKGQYERETKKNNATLAQQKSQIFEQMEKIKAKDKEITTLKDQVSGFKSKCTLLQQQLDLITV